METTKKISFAFTKFSRKLNVLPTNAVENKPIELIDCLEGQSIKLKDVVEEIKGPLIIPLKDNEKSLLDRVRDSKKARKTAVEEDTRPDSELTLDELAARQLLQEAKNNEIAKAPTKIFTLPSAADKLVFEGEKEPTLDDYESVPINDYGLAMLRGMGWSEDSGIGKNNKKVIKTAEPELRPKGMGLGANKIVNKDKKLPAVDKDGKELTLVKGAYAKIIAGKHKSSYCEVIGLDDEAGRIIVKTAIKSLTLSLNEFLVIPVTKEEYVKSSKVINNAKYETYKDKAEIKNEKTEFDINVKEEAPSKQNRHTREYSRSTSSEVSHNTHSKSDHHSTSKTPRGRSSKRRTYSRSSEERKSPKTDHRSRSKIDVKNSRKSHDRNKKDSNSNHRSSSRTFRSKSKETKSVSHKKEKSLHRSRSRSHDGFNHKKNKSQQRSRSRSCDGLTRKKDKSKQRSRSRSYEGLTRKKGRSKQRSRSRSHDYKRASVSKYRSRSRSRDRKHRNKESQNSDSSDSCDDGSLRNERYKSKKDGDKSSARDKKKKSKKHKKDKYNSSDESKKTKKKSKKADKNNSDTDENKHKKYKTAKSSKSSRR